MRSVLFIALLAACGSKSSTTTTPSGDGTGSADEPAGVVTDSRTEIEKRRDAACEALGPRMTKCAVDDARAAHAEGKLSKEQLDQISTPEVQAQNTAEFLKQCKVPMTTRQVRVLEVCPAEESECGPMLACLEHLNDKPDSGK